MRTVNIPIRQRDKIITLLKEIKELLEAKTERCC